MNKFVVLLSGGLDSSVNLYESHHAGKILLAINFNYGQRAALAEKKSAETLTEFLGVKLKTVQLPWFKDFGKSSLLQRDQNIPQGSQVNINSHEQSLKTARSVWVPNRNGIFLNIAAGFAEALGADTIVPGFNLEEAQTFPDNSQEFMLALDQSLGYSTANQVHVRCFTTQLNKSEILHRALELKLPLESIWPCYEAKEKWCGLCESCLRAKRAFAKNKLDSQQYFLE